MSGYSPIVLEFTSAPLHSTIPALRDLLQNGYHFAIPRATPPPSGSKRLVGSISLGDKRVTFEANASKDPDDTHLEHLTVELDTLAYDAAYDLLKEQALPRGKQALTELSTDIARATAAEGLRLRFASEEPILLTIDNLAKAMTSTRDAGLICGISLTSASCPDVRKFWGKSAHEIAGYLVVVSI